MKKVIKKLISKYKEYKNKSTWLDLLNNVLFYTDEYIEDILLASDDFEILDIDSNTNINFICYSNNFIYVPYIDKDCKTNNRFDIYPLSQQGYEFFNRNKPTIH